MSERILVVAPHPDDETLGCGGSLLRHAEEGAELFWLIATAMTEAGGFTPERMAARDREIAMVTRHYGFKSVFPLPYSTGSLDQVARGELIAAIGGVIRHVEPQTLYAPFRGDAHSDHAMVFDACAACSKWFRYPSIRRVRVYKTLSETEFGMGADQFRPNLWMGLEPRHLDGKLAAMALYAGETAAFPFPRSVEAIRAQAVLDGATCGRAAAESFMSLRELV